MAENTAFRRQHEMASAMKSSHLPAKPTDIVSNAEGNGGAREVLDSRGRLRDHEYSNVAEVMDATNEQSNVSYDAGAATSATFVGNATLLLRVGGVTMLTDPSFLHAGDHVHVGYGVFAKRLINPALEFAQLPPLDAILLSHLHADHWDRAAERAIDRGTAITTTPQAASELKKRGFERTLPLETWATKRLAGSGGGSVDITALPAQHGPPPVNRLMPETHGHLLDTTLSDGRTLRIYISGDTLIFDGIHAIAKRFPGIDVAFVHLGGTRIPHRRIGIVTLDANGGIEMLRILAPRTFVPIHNDDWSLFGSSLRDFLDAADADGARDRVRVISRGETLDLAPFAKPA